jgi:sporulation protein YlmC with PRC-barrel domain
MYYSYKELVDAKIYDNTGLYYGYLCGYDIAEKPLLKACIGFNVGDYIPDTDKIREMLRSRGLEVPKDLTLEELVLAARNEGVEIPYIEVKKHVDFVKGYIPLENTSMIDVVYRRVHKGDSRIAVIILNNPREALFRGLPDSINYPRLEYIDKSIGKLVVSLKNGVLGYVEEIVFSSEGVGLRINSENYRSGSILWNKFLSLARMRGFKDLVSNLESRIGSSERIDLRNYGYIYSLLKTFNAPETLYELLNESIEFEEIIVEKYVDLPWSDVLRIGDIILAK